MSRHLVPTAGFALVLFGAVTLILVVTLRPWAGADESYDTHLNFSQDVPDSYSRTDLTWLDTEEAAPQGWSLHNPAPDMDMGYALYVSRGCASCHGLKGEGGAVGDALGEATKSEFRKGVRKGQNGMPAFQDEELTDEQVALIAEYVHELFIAESETTRPVPPPQPTPTPAARATPTPTPTLPGMPTPTPTPTSDPQAEQSPVPSPTPPPVPEPTSTSDGVSLEAAAATITVDGDVSDWASITGANVTLQQIKPIPGVDMGVVDPVNVTLKVAVDSDNIYVLLEIPDDYDYVPDDHGLSAALAVMFRIDEPAAPHMGTTEENQKKSLGMVDIWHWELDCGPGVVSGGGGIVGGNDPLCNLDDEYAETPEDLEDDGTVQAENSLVGVWEHTGRAQGQGAPGTWIFEMSRPLNTGDPQDAQLVLGGTANMALAYWDADETADGWTEVGHLQSSSGGWIEVTLPSSAP